jgi:intracellular septation protein A
LSDLATDDETGPAPSLVRSVGPRLARDVLGPTLSFYLIWKLTGSVLLGIAVGSSFSLIAYRYERRHGRPGVIARLVLAFVVVQAVVGVVTGSATAYLVQPAILGAINGCVWLGSVAIGRPLAGVFAHEVFLVDEQTRSSPEVRAVFRRVSLLFGVFFVVFAAIQLAVLLVFGIGVFVAVRVTDIACTLALAAYCLRYITHRLGHLLVPARGSP